MREILKEKLMDPEVYSLSIVGMAKNTGKTVTLNYLINLLQDITLGVTSIGIDGEKIDNLTSTPKPSINLKRGTLIATGEKTLQEFTGSFEILEGTGIYNPLGEIVIVRLLEDGEVLIGGPERTTDLKRIISRFKSYCCQKVLVDGAIDRRAAASPYITDGMVFVTGAAYSRDLARLVGETVHRLNMLTLPQTSVPLKLQEKIQLICGEEIICLPIKSALLVDQLLGYFKGDRENILYIPGALTDSFVQLIIPWVKKGYKIRIIVKDGTKVFLTPKTYGQFVDSGGTLEVLKSCKPLALSVNPFSVEGYGFDSTILVNNLQRLVSIPVFDPLS
ncbi:hypothetical protein SAMN02745227_00699 [Anaerobranca californiensis DSM 14826]|jgi:hypothetical protein|uniref:Uncharacterized protein n=1 Tax=Anaerobranca californiensis DSM 14826 TaxID=1120989 RepID=A0A1M6M7M3_9FIRM|nr:hypothetical protein [Anaerobranca californiensis]SHJ79424.1 hypothetical protein SAMN02745227_00699 [Anaerobranca californiensis DSM 14826]